MYALKFQKKQPEPALLHDPDLFNHILNPPKHLSPPSAKSCYGMWIYPVSYAEVGKMYFMSNPKSLQGAAGSPLVCSKFQHGNRWCYLSHLVLEHQKHSRDLAPFRSKESSCGRMTKPSKSRKQRQSVQSSALLFPLLPSDVLSWHFTTSTHTATVPYKEYMPPPSKL